MSTEQREIIRERDCGGDGETLGRDMLTPRVSGLVRCLLDLDCWARMEITWALVMSYYENPHVS